MGAEKVINKFPTKRLNPVVGKYEGLVVFDRYAGFPTKRLDPVVGKRVRAIRRCTYYVLVSNKTT